MFEKVDEVVSSGRFIALGLLVIIFLLVGGIPGFQQLGVSAFYRAFPVIHDVKVERVWVEGNDGFFIATARKRHSCELQSIGAENALTRAALVVPEQSRRFWPPDNEMRPFTSPIRVVGAAGLTVNVDFHHQCGGYDVSSPLARIKFPPAKELP